MQEAIYDEVERVSPKKLAAIVEGISRRYRSGEMPVDGESLLQSVDEITAYAAFRLPATFAAVGAALLAVSEVLPRWEPGGLLDVGAGPGTAAWAAAEIWPHLERVTMLERDENMIALGKRLACRSSLDAIRRAAWVKADVMARNGPGWLEPVSCDDRPGRERVGLEVRHNAGHLGECGTDRLGESDEDHLGGRGPLECSGRRGARGCHETQYEGRYDLVTIAYVLGELPDSAVPPLIWRLWDAASGVVVVVEPGTPAGFERIRMIREVGISLEAHVAAPCPHGRACPMPAKDWCHFSSRVSRSRLHRQVKSGELGYEDEKFAYVALSRMPVEPIAGRVVRHPWTGKGHIRMEVCGPDGISTRTVTRKDKAEFKQAKDLEWGSAISRMEGWMEHRSRSD